MIGPLKLGCCPSAMTADITPRRSPRMIDLLDLPSATNPRASERARRAARARNAGSRRRHIDPATCERDYSDAELEFMQAMQDYKMSSGRMFPTWSETLEVLRSLGYEKVSGAT